MTVTVAKLKRAAEDCAQDEGLEGLWLGDRPVKDILAELAECPTALTMLAEELSRR